MTSTVRNTRRSERTVVKSKAGKLTLIALVGMTLLTGLLFLAAAICLHNDASGWVLPLSAYLCCAVSSFPVGCFAAKAVGKSGLFCGLLASFPLCVLLLILCLALYGSVGSGFLIGAALILLCGALGGFAILNRRHKHRYRK